MAVDLTKHPGKNPDYDRLMSARRGIMQENRARAIMGLPLMRVPPQPNKYIPHIGAKQRAKGASTKLSHEEQVDRALLNKLMGKSAARRVRSKAKEDKQNG